MLSNKYQWLDALARCDAPPDGDYWPSSYVRAVGLAITTWMQPGIGEGYCSAAIANIASRAGCSTRQVRRVLDALEEHECIVRTQDSLSRTAVIRLTPHAFDWPPEQGVLELEEGSEPDCQSEYPDCESDKVDCQSGCPDSQSGEGDCESYKDHLEDHLQDHQEDRKPADPRARELEDVFADVGRGDVSADDVDRVLSASTSAPDGYALHRVQMLGRKLLRARASSLADRVVEDLEARRWVCDPGWHELQREQAAEEARARRREEFEREEAEEAARQARRDAVWDDVGDDQRDAWRKHFEREDEWLRVQRDPERRSYIVRQRTIDALIEHGQDAMPPEREPPPPPKEVHIDIGAQLAAMRTAITGQERTE